MSKPKKSCCTKGDCKKDFHEAHKGLCTRPKPANDKHPEPETCHPPKKESKGCCGPKNGGGCCG